MLATSSRSVSGGGGGASSNSISPSQEEEVVVVVYEAADSERRSGGSDDENDAVSSSSTGIGMGEGNEECHPDKGSMVMLRKIDEEGLETTKKTKTEKNVCIEELSDDGGEAGGTGGGGQQEDEETEPLISSVAAPPFLPSSSRHLAFSGSKTETEVAVLRSTVQTLRDELATSERKRNQMEHQFQKMQDQFKIQLEQIRQNQDSQNKRLTIMSNNSNSISISGTTNNNNNQEKLLPQDTFSFLMVCSTISVPFALALFVYTFQMTTFALVTLDMVRGHDDDGSGGRKNPLGIPGDVSAELRAAQFIAILVAVFTQGDLFTAFEVFRDGYNNDISWLFLQQGSATITYWKYCLSLLARLSEGCVGLIVSFLLIITADTVVELLLNFTAIEFVSNLDDLLFFLSKQGFLGKRCKKQAMLIRTTKFEVTKMQNGKAWKSIMVTSILVSMLVGWGVVIHKQSEGHFFCRTIQVQFGDESVPALGTFSGLYDLETKPYTLFGNKHRVEYIERRSLQVGSKRVARFAFCSEISAWIFYWDDDHNNNNNNTRIDARKTRDPCEDIWVARSASMDTYDLTDTAGVTWYSRNIDKREVELSPFHLSCFECKSNDDCRGRGICRNAVCACEEPWQGLRCDFQPCSDLSVDSQNEPFASTRDWASNFYILHNSSGKTVEAYHRPVYIHDYDTGEYDIILFTGRRWALTSLSSLPITKDTNFSNDHLADFFSNQFHAYAEDLSVSFLSEGADIGTEKDTASPVDFQWFRVRSESHPGMPNLRSHAPGKPVSSVLLCQICNNSSNPCQYDGICRNGTCKCSPGAAGVLCQDAPAGNGYCNKFFNTPEFKYDGGDCCESTCVSSQSFDCGYNSKGRFIGYGSCKQEKEVWFRHGDTIVGEAFARSGSQIAISDNGAVLAVAEPGMTQVRLFDKDGSEWIERAAQLHDLPLVEIGNIAISTGKGNLLRTPTFLPPVLMGISGVSTTGSSVAFIYYCVIEACHLVDTILATGPIIISGKTIAVGLVVFEFSKEGLTLKESLNISNIDYELVRPSKLSVNQPYYNRRDILGNMFISSVSQDGNRLALGMNPSALATYSVGGPEMTVTHAAAITLSWNGSTYLQDQSHVYKVECSGAKNTIPIPSLSMTGDGMFILATLEMIKGSGCKWHQKSFEYKGGNWVEQSPNMTVECQDRKVSKDGQSYVCDMYNGTVSVFDWNGLEWELADRSLQGETPVYSALSSDGHTLVLGRPSSQLNYAGGTAVYTRTSQLLAANESLFRVSFTPRFMGTKWYLHSNKSGELLIEDHISSAWEVASGTETKVVANDDCLVFTIYPTDLPCQLVGETDLGRLYCVPPSIPYPLGPARFDLFLNETHIKGKLFDSDKQHSVRDTYNCGEDIFPPSRIYIGDCFSCPAGTQRVQVMVHTCPASVVWKWEMSDDLGHKILGKTALMNVSHSWDSACLDVGSTCYNFSIWDEREAENLSPFNTTFEIQNKTYPSHKGHHESIHSKGNARQLQGARQGVSWFYSIMVGDEVVASNIDTFWLGSTRRPPSEATTSMIGDCITPAPTVPPTASLPPSAQPTTSPAPTPNNTVASTGTLLIPVPWTSVNTSSTDSFTNAQSGNVSINADP